MQQFRGAKRGPEQNQRLLRADLLTNFGVSGMIRSRLIGQHLSDASRDLATLSLDLGGHGARRSYRSSCYVFVPSLKFIGLSIRKI